MDAIYFKRPEEFRDWLADHHDQETELVVGFYKKGTGIPSMTWAEAVDEALCYGWIDGRGNRVDEQRYTIRFSPRKPSSIWSDRNIKRVEALTAEARMQPAGVRAFEARSEERSRVYSFEQDSVSLSPAFEQRLKENEAAWHFFRDQAPWYQRAAIHWVMTAKRESTRERRMEQLITDSARNLTIPPLTRRK